MSAAEQFNPYGLHAIRIPLGMLAYPSLTWGAKCLYGRLALHLGKPREGAHCDAGLDKLASEMGTSVDTIDRWLKELTDEKFIKRRRRGRLAAECVFLQHPCLSNSATMRNQEAVPIPQPCGVEEDSNSASVPLQFRNHAVSIPQNGAFLGSVSLYKNIHENIHEDIQSSVVPVVPANDDESSFSSEKKKEDSSLARKMYGNGKGEFTPADRETLIEGAQDTLRGSIASIRARYEDITQTAALKATHTPDKEITRDILNAFLSFDDFQAWITDTENRGLASKARDPHAVYALYRQDAKIRAEDIHAERLKAEQRATEEAIEDERQRAAEAAEVKLVDTPLPALQAFGLIQGRLNGHRVPAPLKAALERTGELIAPNALDAAIRGWKRCARCDDGGTVGHAFYRTLAFCTCPAGIEAAYDKGADWPTEEIARVHGSTKDKLVGAARTISVYLGDAIDASNLTETPSELVFDVPKGYRLYFKEKGFSEVFKLAGEQRTIRLMGMTA